MRFRLAAVALLVLSAACGEDGETYTVRTRLLSPVDVTDPLAGLATVRLRVIQDGEVRGEREFAPDDAWKIPSGADPGDPLVLRIDGLDSGGAVIRTGVTRSLVPDDSKGRTFGVFFSTPGEFASPPTLPLVPRESADVEALPDGRAVVFGGDDGTGTALDAVSLYDPDSGTWRELAPLAEARISPAVAVLPDGLTLLIAGGTDSLGDELGSTELYRVPAAGADPGDAGDTTPGPALVTPWTGLQVAPLASGKIVLAGGYSDGAPLPAIYDPAGGSLFEIPGGTFAPAASVTATGDGRVAIVGGATPETASRVDVVSEDSNGDVVLTTGVGALRVPRNGASAVSIGPGRLVVSAGEVATGGITAGVEVVELAGTGVTSSLVERERVRRHFRPSERLGDGRVLLAGGRDPVGSPTSRAFVFDPASNHVEEVGSLPEPLSGRRYTVPLPDGSVLLFGADGSSDVRIFQPPVDPLVGTDRVDLAVTLTEGQRATGAVLDGATTMRVRFFDDVSEVHAIELPPSSVVTVPGFVTDADVHVLVEAADAAGATVAWAATSAPIDQAAQATGALSLLIGRVGEFVLAPQSLPSPHEDGAAAQLDDGRVVVAAGEGGSDVTDVFDPGSGAAAQLNADIPVARRDVRATIAGGALVLAGAPNGANAPSTAMSLLDLATGVWSASNALPAPGRNKHVVITLGDGSVLAHGNDARLALGTVMPGNVWNGATWSSLNVPVKRSHHRAALLGDGDVLLVGGMTTSGGLAVSATAETYDPAGQSFTPAAGTMDDARRDHVAFAIPGGDAVVCGGLVGTGNSAPLATCERYSTATRTFSAAGSLSLARDDSACVSFPDGTSWILGGGTGMNGVSASAVDVWDGGIAPGPSLRIPRATPAAVALRDGRLVVAGGRDAETDTTLSSVEIHTPPAWTNPFGY